MYILMNPNDELEHKNGYEEFITNHTSDEKSYRVSGKPTKIKGYSGFEFFMHKRKTKEFHVREKKTGMKIAVGVSMPEAKKLAKATLDKETSMNNTKLNKIINDRLKEIRGEE